MVLAGLALLALPGATTATGRHLRPSEWGRLNLATMRLGLWAVQVGLFLIAAPTVLRAAGVHSVADACHSVLGPIIPGGALTGWVSAAASIGLFVAARVARQRAVRLQRAARVDSWLGEHQQRSGAAVVLLPTDAIVAYAAPGSPPQVVLSRGLADSLTPDELDAVVRHELAHLRHGHDRYLVSAAVIDATLGWIPRMRRSTATLRLSVERWADEAAAQQPGMRDSIRRALLKTTETMLAPLPAFMAASTLVARLDALGTPPPDPTCRQRVTAAGPVLALASVVAACVVLWSTYTHHGLLGLLGFCPL